MSSSFANQTLAQIELFTRPDYYQPGKVYVLPKHLDEKVARLQLDRLNMLLKSLGFDTFWRLWILPLMTIHFQRIFF